MSKIFVLTDIHLGHDRMVEFCGRPEDHSEKTLNNLKLITHGSKGEKLLIFLGDFCIGRDEYWHKEFFARLVSQLGPVHTIMVKGNHDNKSNSWYRSHGWNAVVDSFTLRYGGKMIEFVHVPTQPRVGVDVQIHGHWHGKEHSADEDTMAYYDNTYHLLVVHENNRLKPVLLDKILSDFEQATKYKHKKVLAL